LIPAGTGLAYHLSRKAKLAGEDVEASRAVDAFAAENATPEER